MGKYNKEELEKLILEDKLTYDKIGEIYNVSGNAIRKAANRLEIALPQRRKINKCETFNKKEDTFCLFCNEIIPRGRKYCNKTCQNNFEYSEYISKWKENIVLGNKGATQTSAYVRRYLFEKYDSSCSICGWNQKNIITTLCPLEIHHIDGDCTNNKEENLDLLCPNCHSLTDNFGSLNKNSTRFHRQKNTLDD